MSLRRHPVAEVPRHDPLHAAMRSVAARAAAGPPAEKLRAEMVLHSGRQVLIQFAGDMSDADFGELVLEIAGPLRAAVAERRNAAPGALPPAPRIFLPGEV